MESLKSVFTPCPFEVEVVTPVHVGMAQEKNYVRGLDYVLESGEIWVIDTDRLFRLLDRNELQNLTLKLADGQARELETTLKSLIRANPSILLQKLPVQGEPTDIRRMYRTGLGQYAIPGSSIKGAIRSILLAELKKLPGSNRHSNAELDKLFGNITNNLMRFIQVGDVNLPKEMIEVRRTKIFSADSDRKDENTRGEWKHANRGNHTPAVVSNRPDAFVTWYESAVPQSVPTDAPNTLLISLGSNLPHALGKYVSGNVPNYTNLLNGKSGDWLLDTIRSHTKQYLDREKAYFRKFRNDDLDKQKFIEERINALIQFNSEADSCLLRVGAGVGFHSITGDWQNRSQDHFSEWIDISNQIFAKTRKFSFRQQNSEFEFMLMGFIKLTLQTPETEQARQRKRVLAQEKAEAVRLATEQERSRAEAEKRQQQEAERLAELERRKPQLFEGRLKKGQLLDAEIVLSARTNKVKVYATGYENQLFDLVGYVGAEPLGRVVLVKVDQLSKKDVLQQVRYDKMK